MIWSTLKYGVMLVVVTATLADPVSAAKVLPDPLVIGHRGASGHLPEHTLEAYALAITLGADFIEPDVVATKDGRLIARHEPNLIATTDVGSRPEFQARKRTMVVDGVQEVGYFASDFTLAEIKTLRAVQAFGERDQSFNGVFGIPTLEEVIDLAKRKSAETGRTIGIYPETKHPTYHQALGLALEDRLVNVLQRAQLNRRDAPVFIQSFETANLKYLRSRTRVHLVQLVDANDVAPDGTITYAPPFDRPYDWTVAGETTRTFGDLLTPAGLAEVASYADGVGPWKPYLIPSKCIIVVASACVDANGDGVVNEADRALLPPTAVLSAAKERGLVVHTWTFRNEQRRLAADYGGNPLHEYLRFFELGVDGVFSDFPDTAHAARIVYLLRENPTLAKCLVDAHAQVGTGNDKIKCKDLL